MSDFNGIGTGQMIQVAYPGAPIFSQVDSGYDPYNNNGDSGLVLGDLATTGLLITGRLSAIRADLAYALAAVDEAIAHRPDLV